MNTIPSRPSLPAIIGQPVPTIRPTSHLLEDMMLNPVRMLDHGFIRVVDYMGVEQSIVNAARTSYGTGTKAASEDKGLLRYLLRHKHTTPFEMGEICFHAKMPIFVARQWIRHRTANINEYSARYSVLDKEFFIPEEQTIATQSKNNKQGRAISLDHAAAVKVQELLKRTAEFSYDGYEKLLGEQPTDEFGPDYPGLARELARMNLTLNYYTQWYWKCDVHNLMNFLRLRVDKHAQYEIRVYADYMASVLKAWMPNVHQAMMDYLVESFNLSKPMINLLRYLLATRGGPVDLAAICKEADVSFGELSKRELDELSAVLFA